MANALLAAPGSHSGSKPPLERPPVRLVVVAVVLLTALGWAALSAADGAPVAVYGPALALAAATGLIGGVSARRMPARQKRHQRSAPVDDLVDLPRLEIPQYADGELPPSDTAPGALAAVAELREDVTVRTLRAQVHTLEQALEQVQGTLAQRQQETMELAEHRRSVLLTIQAIADRTTGAEGGRTALSRVAAAVERLGAPDVFARPVLPPPGYDVGVASDAPAALVGAARAEPVGAEPQPEPQSEPQPQSQPATPGAEAARTTLTASASSAPTDSVQAPAPLDTPDLRTEPASDVVLPVPPRPVASVSHGRSWRRVRAS
ncbi:hypothetical protein [Nocardioides pacificus]